MASSTTVSPALQLFSLKGPVPHGDFERSPLAFSSAVGETIGEPSAMARFFTNGVQAARSTQVTVCSSVASTVFTPTPDSSEPKTNSA